MSRPGSFDAIGDEPIGRDPVMTPPDLVQLTERVWVCLPDPDPTAVRAAVGIVAGDGASLIVDAGHSPRFACAVKRAMTEVHLPEAKALVYTHHHWDHVWGAQVWDVPVIAHQQCSELLRAESAKVWTREAVESRMQSNSRLRASYSARLRAIRDWDGLRHVLPDVTFENEYQVEVGGVSIELVHPIAPHSQDSTVVSVPGERVRFVGDCYYSPPPYAAGADTGPDLAFASTLLSDDFDWYVEGHEPPRHRSTLPGFADEANR